MQTASQQEHEQTQAKTALILAYALSKHDPLVVQRALKCWARHQLDLGVAPEIIMAIGNDINMAGWEKADV